MTAGRRLQSRLEQIASCSETTRGVTRLPYTSQHHAALTVIGDWMRAAGLAVTLDAAGSLVGRSPGDGPALLIGSHQDSVRHGGRYDGIMGVAVGCLAIETLIAEGRPPAFPVEVIAFADEEGVRFPTALVGSRALAGRIDPEVLDMRDADGVILGEALTAFGGDPRGLAALARDPGQTRGYLEIHIEQGPVLETEDLPLGVVTGICGIERNAVRFEGETGHAGTVPMAARRDALVAAGEFTHRVHDLARDRGGDLKATIGTLSVGPGAVNGIPDRAALTLEIRDIDGRVRSDFAKAARALGQEIAARRGVSFDMTRTYAQAETLCSAVMMQRLDAIVAKTQGRSLRLPSGATHDASAMADLCDIAMLFVRCRAGISHRPDEYVSDADLGAAVAATAHFITALGAGDT